MKRLLVLLFTVFFSPLVLAQSIGSIGNLSLTPPPGDVSVAFLSNIFGSVDGVLHGSGSQLLGNMFGVFNAAVLFLGGLVILYTLLISTLNTAHEGEVLGKDWSSIWVPLKMVTGIALLIPKASGYSFIQIFMMWVAVMGIGAADSMWNVAVNYLSQGGSLIQQNQPVPASLLTNSGTVFKSLACTFTLQNQLKQYRNDQISNGVQPIAVVPDFYQAILTALNTNGSSGLVQFPPSTLPAPYDKLAGACGSVSWTAASAKVLPYYVFDDNHRMLPQYHYMSAAYNSAKKQAVSEIITNLVPGAILAAANYDRSKLPLGKMLSTSPLQWGWDDNKPYILPGSLLSDSASSYMAIMSPVVRTLTASSSSSIYNTKDLANSKDQGWALASTYYYDITQANTYATSAWSSAADFTATGPSNDLSNSSIITSVLPANSAYVGNINTMVNGNANYAIPSYLTQATSYGQQLTYGRVTPVNSYRDALGGGDSGEIVAALLSAVSQGMTEVFEGFWNLENAQGTNEDPVISVARLGAGLVSQSVTWMITISGIVFDITFAMGAFFGTTFSSAMLALITPLTSALTPIFVLLLTTGITLAFYLPLIPFILFTFGVVGWFITVIEAMCAAPLVALGITHPGGHPILGKADPAVLLLVNVFIRPTLMIIGLLVGMMLSYVSVWLLNKGFFHIISSSVWPVLGGLSFWFAWVGVLIVYTAVIVQLMHKSFSLTYVIPDQVFKWIGTNIQGMGGEEQAEQAIAGSVHKAAEGAASAVGTATKGMGEAGEKVGGAVHSAAGKAVSTVQKGAQTAISAVGSVAGSAGGGGGGGGGGAVGGVTKAGSGVIQGANVMDAEKK